MSTINQTWKQITHTLIVIYPFHCWLQRGLHSSSSQCPFNTATLPPEVNRRRLSVSRQLSSASVNTHCQQLHHNPHHCDIYLPNLACRMPCSLWVTSPPSICETELDSRSRAALQSADRLRPTTTCVTQHSNGPDSVSHTQHSDMDTMYHAKDPGAVWIWVCAQ